MRRVQSQNQQQSAQTERLKSVVVSRDVNDERLARAHLVRPDLRIIL